MNTSTLKAIAILCRDHHPEVSAVCRLDPLGLRLVQKRGRQVKPTLIEWRLIGDDLDLPGLVEDALDRGVQELGL